jgi:spore maturation protein CgeB
MKSSGRRLVFLGLSLSSSWGNGHATTYRALLRALAERGHRILFLERERPWYADNRDLARPDFCRLGLYETLAELRKWRRDIAEADAVIVGSYVPQGVSVIRWVLETARGVTGFYDIDTPVTLAKLQAGDHAYLSPKQIADFDLYLSFTGGPTLRLLEQRYGARAARALYCSVDPAIYRPVRTRRRWHLGYLGTFSADRQPALESLLIQPARRNPHLKFVVAGPQYPDTIAWPPNVERIDHVPPSRHARFYSSVGWTLNLTRVDMVRLGFSPSVRLFEAAACAAPIISDSWTGLDTLFTPGRELLTAVDAEHIAAALCWPEAARSALGRTAQQRVLAKHTAAHRAQEFESYLIEAELAPSETRKVLA